MSIRLTFACGHQLSAEAKTDLAPTCWCGERRIARVVAKAPRFRGLVLAGGCGEPGPAEAIAITVGSAPLRLKEPKEESDHAH